MTKWLPLAALAFFAGLAFLKYGGQAQSAGLFLYEDADVVAQGKVLYGEYCAACHGAKLEGEEDWRTPKPGGKMPAPPHDQTGHTWHHPEEQLFNITKYGTAALVGPSYKTDMVGFEDQLSDAEIIAVLSFIKASWPAQIRKRHDRMSR